MIKLRVDTLIDGLRFSEVVECDDYYVGDVFLTFDKDDFNFLRIPVRYVTRIEYIGEHTE